MPCGESGLAIPDGELKRIREMLAPTTTGATCGAHLETIPMVKVEDRTEDLRIEALEREYAEVRRNRSELLEILGRSSEARKIREGMVCR